MALIALVILGSISYFRLPAELNPRVDIPTFTVTTVIPGSGPREVESQVSKVIEDALNSVPNVKDVFSSSQESVSIVSVDLKIGSDIDKSIAAARDRIEAIRNTLPAECRSPVIAKLDINAQPILQISISGTASLFDLRATIEKELQPRISKLSGVASVTITGGLKREVKVAVDASKLSQRHLTIQDIVDAIKSGGANISGGKIVQGKQEIDVRTVGAYSDLQDILSTPIPASLQYSAAASQGSKQPLSPTLISDVANVNIGNAPFSSVSRINGVDCIGITITKTSDSNTVQVISDIRDVLKTANRYLPSDSKIITSRDDSEVVHDALQDVNFSLILGALLAMGVVFLFLRNLRGTIIVAIALPTCLVVAFLSLYMFGYTLNQMTLLALSLSVGILIDDSIVVLESITRHLGLGKAPKEAAYDGRTEIGFADITTTLADVVVFLPIAFMGGIVGAFFRQFGITVVVSTLFSLIVSFTVTPALASRWYKAGENPEEPQGKFFGWLETIYGKLESSYKKLLITTLKNRFIIVTGGFILLVAVLLVTLPYIGTDLLPSTDVGLIAVTVELPPGSSLAATDDVVRKAEAVILKNPEVMNEVSNVGQILGGFGAIPQEGSQFAQINVRLKDKRDLMDVFGGNNSVASIRSLDDNSVAKNIRSTLMTIPGARFGVSTIRSVAATGLPIQLQLKGKDLSALNSAANQIKDRLLQMPGIFDPDISYRVGKPEIRITPDRAMLAAEGIPATLAGAIIHDAVEGNTDSRFHAPSEDMVIRVQLSGVNRNEPSDLLDIAVGNRSGKTVRLEDVARVERASGPIAIDRINGDRMVTISADLSPDYPLGNAQSDITKRLADVPLTGIDYHFAGDSEAMDENIPYFASALGLSVILVYLVMASLFNSLLNPFVIMFTLPMALTGAMAALALVRQSLSLVSMIGIMMLVGLMGRNAILLIDYTGTLRSRGKPRNEAVVEGGVTRLRPILMTSIATIVGMAPVALKIGKASELRAPMATVVIGGMLVSTFLTLLIIPALYTIADDTNTFVRHRILKQKD